MQALHGRIRKSPRASRRKLAESVDPEAFSSKILEEMAERRHWRRGTV
jgi:hypothetical protein